MDMPTNERLAADLRLNRIIWLAIGGGVVMLTAVFLYLMTSDPKEPSEDMALFFYINALVSMGAIGAGFFIQRTLTQALPQAGTYEEAAGLIRSRHIVSIAILEGSVFFAAIAAFISGELINFAFLVPFFAFWFLFFPNETRYRYLLAIWQGG